MPQNNNWSIVGGAIAVVAVFVLTALLNFFNSGVVWPADAVGWAHILVPSLVAGLLAVITPNYSMSEAKTGHRVIDSKAHDAPVLDKGLPAVFNDPTSHPVIPPLVPPTPPLAH